MTLAVVANGGNGCFAGGEKQKGRGNGFLWYVGTKTHGLGHSKHQNVNITNMMPRISMQQEDSEETCN